MTSSVDAVVIGSGHNGLVAAAYLARAGWRVEALERNAVPGGAIATEELTQPGFQHDTFSCWHTQFHRSATLRELGAELKSRGLEYVNARDAVTATVAPDGRVVFGYREPASLAAGLPSRDGRAYLDELATFADHSASIADLLALELRSVRAMREAIRLARALGPGDRLPFVARSLESARSWLQSRFAGDEIGLLLAPWILHAGLTPDDGGGALQLVGLARSLHEVGLPVVRGGSLGFVNAFVRLIEDNGGSVRTGAEVESIIVRGGRAAGVTTAGERILARRAVIANTTPTQLYGRLLPAGTAPERAVEEAQAYQYGDRAGAQIHLALSEAPRWRGDPRLARTPIVHLSGGLDSVSLACTQAKAGLLPAEPTIVCGQPTAIDPSRAPDGGAAIWIQLQEVPYHPIGDAAGEIDVGDGTWDPELEAAYADRIQARLGRHIDGLDATVIGRSVISPAALERRNPNLGRGDIYAGATQLHQSYLWRPLPSFGAHATPVRGLYCCGASTHPGPGLNGASGRIVAENLLRRSFGQRVRRTLQRPGP